MNSEVTEQELESLLGSTTNESDSDTIEEADNLAPSNTDQSDFSNHPQDESHSDPVHLYNLISKSEHIEIDDTINERLFAAGFTAEQAQLVYDLAAEHITPVVDELHSERESEKQLHRLEEKFGGKPQWDALSKQLKTWGSANLEPSVFETLSANFDGVVAMHSMMQASEPKLIGNSGDAVTELTEAALEEMVRDERYWRKQDPEFVARVSNGYKKLFSS